MKVYLGQTSGAFLTAAVFAAFGGSTPLAAFFLVAGVGVGALAHAL